MAKAKNQSKSQSAKKSTAKSTQKSATRSTAGRNQQADQGVAQASMSKAREFVSSNANLPTAGLALAGAGVLALVSTAAGRNLIKAAAEAVISLVNLPAVTEAIPESLKTPFKSNDKKDIGGKTDFAVTATAKRGGKQNQKSTKAQI